jgi:acyl-homoserine-lactone acylase
MRMRRTLSFIVVAGLSAFAGPLLASPAAAQQPSAQQVGRWQQQARHVTILRDDWGIPHVSGKSDADAVFGLMYAQAEDDFYRVETNYLNSMGRLAEAEGPSAVYRDLRMKLFIDPDSMKVKYAASPAWLKKLMTAWADGLNYYLYKHPQVTPRAITHFEPWMALTFSEGSIGGDIERVNLTQLEAFYGNRAQVPQSTGEGGDGNRGNGNRGDGSWGDGDGGNYREPSGSNGIAIAPSNTIGHHALLLINPHTSFFFRAEVQMTSDEGLNAYGAVTWGQFFVYQGFNERAGWMHTSSGVDAVDEYLETVTKKGGRFYYRYGTEERPLAATRITVPFRTPTGMGKKEFTVYRTHHGPIVRDADGKWVSVRLMQEPLKALMQSYSRTKARSYKAFKQTMELHTNSSNNTIFADADGDVAYFHANFIPKRDARFDFTKPVDGSDPATEWQGVLTIDQSPKLLNPPNGWLFNVNNAPWSAAGAYSPKKSDYPAYVETGGESARGVHAIRVLKDKKDFTVESLVAAAYDSYLPAFAQLVPSLLSAYDGIPSSDPLEATLAEQVKVLRGWDYRWSVTSVPTSLAVFWGEELGRRAAPDARKAGVSVDEYVATRTTPEQRLQALAAASDQLTADFGSWRTPWGTINRFQRLTGDIVQPFNDAGSSIPVGFTSARWGSLASFGARPYPGTKKWYGTSGNSFVAVVEFGDRVRAQAITAGGESGDPASKHFNDQAERYSTGALREVYFYPAQLEGHTERQYHPGS